MVLTCTLGASLLAAIDRDTLRTTLLAALGCNIAWGIIDAALYVMGKAFVRSRNRSLLQAIRSAPDDAAALAVVREALLPQFDRMMTTTTAGLDDPAERIRHALLTFTEEGGTWRLSGFEGDLSMLRTKR